MRNFDDLDVDEQRNEILKGIHNQLAQINKWLEVGIALYAKLSSDDIEDLKTDVEYIFPNVDDVTCGGFSNTGYTREHGLYEQYMNGDKEIKEPLGEYDRTAEIDPKTGFFAEDKGGNEE